MTRGDLTQRIAVEAQGEVAELKDNINQMIVTLRETTKKNAEQGWLDSNLARIGGLLQGQRDLGEVCRMIMTEVTPLVDAQLGAFFLADDDRRRRCGCGWPRRYGYVARRHDGHLRAGRGAGRAGRAVAGARSGSARRPTSRLTVRSGLADDAAGRPGRAAGAVRGRAARA